MTASGSRIATAGLLVACCVLAACGERQTSGQIQWAREALARNPTIEVLAVDEANGVFTVRSRANGELRTLKLGELVAGPAPMSAAAPRMPPDGGTNPEAAVATPALQEDARPEEGGEAALATPEGQTPYTVDRSGGRLQITGPGISVASTAPRARAAARPAAAVRPAGRAADDPVVCEGGRFLRIDNRSLAVEGDAVIAREGCELYLTNSRITGTGRGIVAEGARVYVRNSTVEGTAASIDASRGADVYLQSSILRGLARQLGGATVHDLGGNTWR